MASPKSVTDVVCHALTDSAERKPTEKMVERSASLTIFCSDGCHDVITSFTAACNVVLFAAHHWLSLRGSCANEGRTTQVRQSGVSFRYRPGVYFAVASSKGSRLR